MGASPGGIDRVELDYIQGVNIARYWPDKVAAFVKEFRDAGVEVISLRLEFLPEDPRTIIRACQTAGVPGYVLPLVGNLEECLDLHDGDGLRLEFSNLGIAGVNFSALQKPISAQCGVRFNPVNFVKAGEMPFLRSYGEGRFIRSMTSLDVNDALWDGTPRRLMQGNAEIKELVSIVRCRNFAGTLVLGGGAPCAVPAREFCDDFKELLATL